MLDESERRLLEEIRAWHDPGPHSWRHVWWNWILVGGGLALAIASAIDTGRMSGSAGGFMVGVGLMALLIAVPIARRLRLAYRLVRHADAAKFYDPPAGSPTRP